MNERIKELAEQARNYALDEKRILERMHNTEQPMEEYRDVYNKKFAELIVKECADTAYQSLYEDRIFDDVPANIRRNVMDAIKQHFGVK